MQAGRPRQNMAGTVGGFQETMLWPSLLRTLFPSRQDPAKEGAAGTEFDMRCPRLHSSFAEAAFDEMVNSPPRCY